ERKIANVFLVVFVVSDPAGGLQLAQIEVRQLPVIGKSVDAKVNGLVLSLIGEPFGDERADHFDHSVDVTLVCGTGECVGTFDSQPLQILEKLLLELPGKFRKRNAG